VRRIAELGGDQRLEVLGEDVLEHLGLGVHTVPGHAQAVGEKALQQTMVADNLQRQPAPLGGEAHAAVGDVAGQPQLVELLEHARDGARGDAQPLGQGICRYGLFRARLQREDGLGVVLHGGRTEHVLGSHGKRIWPAKTYVKPCQELRRNSLPPT